MKTNQEYELYNLTNLFSPTIDNKKIREYYSLSNTDNRIAFIDEKGSIYLYEKSSSKEARLINIKTDIGCIKISLGGNHIGYIDMNSNFYLSDVLTKFNFVGKHVTHISLGNKHAAFINSHNELFMFGNNDYGQLGMKQTYEPKRVKEMVIDVVCGDNHTIYLDSKYDMYGTGRNNRGQLGLGHRNDIENFQVIATNVYKIFAKFDVTGAITDDILYLCGDNSHGKLTINNKSYLTTLTETFEDVKRIGIGKDCIGILNNKDQLYFSGKYGNKNYVEPVFVLNNCYDFSFANENFKIAIVYSEITNEDLIVQRHIINDKINLPYNDILKYGKTIIKTIAEIIVNDISFPFKKNFMKEVDILYDQLKDYQPKFLNEKYELNTKINDDLIPLGYLDENLVLYLNATGGSEIDDLPDYFVEYNRIDTKSYNELYTPRESFGDVKFIEKVIYSLLEQKKDINSRELRKQISLSINEPILISPLVPYSFYKKFQPKKILDLSVNWGSNLIAAIAFNVEKYVGFESNKLLKKPHSDIIESFTDEKDKYQIHYNSIEKTKLSQKFDYIVFDPLFDPNNELSMMDDQEQWMINYLFKYLYDSWNNLSDNGILTINVNDIQHIKIVEPMVLFIVSFLEGAFYEGVIPYKKDEIYNPIWIFRKFSDLDKEDVSDYPILFKQNYHQLYNKCLKKFSSK